MWQIHQTNSALYFEDSAAMTRWTNLNSLINRSRAVYAILVAADIILGLASRKFAWLLPAILKKNAGDILWATMVFFLIGLLVPRLPTIRIALYAALFSIFIEFFKLVHSPALDVVRNSIPGRLVLGYGFSWSNLVCYMTGILLGVIVELSLYSGNPSSHE